MGQQHAMVALLLVGFFGRQALGLALVQSYLPTEQIPEQAATSLVLSQSLAEPTLAEAKRLYEEVNQLYAQGRYDEALNLAKQVLRILEQGLPSNNPNIPHGFEQVARLLSWLDRHDEAETYYTIAQLLREGGRATPIQSEKMPELPNSIIGQLDARSLQANNRDYLELTDPLLSNQLLQKFPRLPLTGGYFNIHRFDGVAGQTVNLAVTSDDLDDLLILVFSRQGGFLAAASGKSTQFALPLEEAGFYQVTVGSRTPGRTGNYRLRWGTVGGRTASSSFTYRGEHARIPRDADVDLLGGIITTWLPALEEKMAALRTELGDRHPQLAEPLISLAVFYTQLERWTDAESAYTEALSILQAQSNPNLQHLVWAIDGLASIAYQRGDLERATVLYQTALTRERVALENLIPQGGENAFMARRAIASWLNALAGIYQQQQRYDEAETLLVEMLEIVQGLGKSRERVAFLQSVVNFYRTQGRHDKAAPLLEQMLATIRALDESSDQALLLESLANDYRAEGRYDQAEALYRESIDIQETVSGRDRADNPSSLHDLALAYHTQGRYAEAERAYRQALTAVETVYRDEQQAFWVSIFYNLAGLYQAQKRIPAALEVLEEGIDLEQQQFDRNLATLNEAARQRYAASVANTLNHVISLHLNTAPDNSNAAQLAATTLLRRKGRVLEAGITTLELLERNPNPEDRRLLTELDRLRRQAAEFSFGDAALSPQTSAQLRSLRSKIENIEAILARRSAALVVETPPVELADVQSRLPANGALVEYVRYRPFDPINPLSGN
ncbi:MAG: tetratricopeptide repeat protein [Desertifilum sp. SIO1I2]|nr:tetratricopeptide repeat protein [Desertifilum sp. SIO1I2]